jgi:hypothetical protein
MFCVVGRDRTFPGEFETRDQADERLADLFENDPGAPEGFYWIETTDEDSDTGLRGIDETTSETA